MTRAWRLWLVIALAAAGVGISAKLTSIHHGHVCHGVPGSCIVSESSTCDLVNTSKWSELAGVPVAHLGMLTYLLVLGLAAAALARGAFRPRAHAYVFLVSIWCVLFSMFMAFISLFVIKAVCDWCVSLYAINLAILATLWGGGFRTAYEFPEHLAEEWRWVRRPLGALAVIAAAVLYSAPTLHLRHTLEVCRERNKSVVRIDTTGRPFVGPERAKVTIVEISDFECPFCRNASGTLANVLEGYRGKVKLVFIHFPLDDACNPAINRPFHRGACLAAKAAWCAGSRGFFWKYARALFEGALDRAALISAARGAGIDPAAFEVCLDSKEAGDAVARDIKAGMEISVHKEGVPYFLINGRKVVGAKTPAEFKKIIDEELAAAP